VAEIVNGELHASPRPAPPHTVAASVLGGRLVSAFHEAGAGRAGGGSSTNPNSIWARTCWCPTWRDAPHADATPARTAFFTLAPDWICEVLSPSTSQLDRAKKLAVYAREGVGPRLARRSGRGTLEVLRLENGRWSILATHAGSEVVRAEPFAEIEIELQALWID